VTIARSATGQEEPARVVGKDPCVPAREVAAASLLMAMGADATLGAAPGADNDATGAEAPVLPGAPAGDPATAAAYARAVVAAITAGLGMLPPTAPLPRGANPVGMAALSKEAVNASV